MTRPQSRFDREWDQFRILSRDSVRRLLNTAVLTPDGDPMQFALWITVLIATPTAMFAFGQPFKYARLAMFAPEVIEATVLRDRMFFATYAMLAMALLAALTWEALFPDGTDLEILAPLPVRPRTVAAARLAAALGVALAFALALNVPAALLFSLVATTHPSLGSLPVVVLAHSAALVGGCMFVFLALLLVRGLVAVTFGADAADRLATVLQLLAVVALIEVFFYLPAAMTLLIDHMLSGPEATRWLPPAWFVSLYSSLVGSPRDVFAPQAVRAVIALTAAAALVFPLYLLSAPMMARRALESPPRRQRGLLARTLRAAGRAAPHPIARAIAEFTITTLWRSRRHLLIVVSYAGAGVAVAAVGVIAARLGVGFVSPAPTIALLSAPLVLMFFLVLGLRAAFRIPGDFDANWPFRLLTPAARAAAAGTQVAMLALAVAPVSLLFGVITVLAAGRSVSEFAMLLVFDLAAGWPLTEAVLLGWARIPFACAHIPDESSLKTRWLLYLIPLNVFAFRGADAQLMAMASGRHAAAYLAVVISIALSIRAARLARARRETISFDSPASQDMAVLNLSEALQ